MKKYFCGILILAFASLSPAEICKKWSEPLKVGQLNIELIPEASGLAYSKNFPQRLYHNNDSGDGPFFYITDLVGNNTQKIEIANFKPQDVEEIVLGTCLENQSCIYLADIGDNKEQRKQVEILLIREDEIFAQPVVPLSKLVITYPDHPHNAEAMVVHPNGDIYVITKEFSFITRKASSAQIFRIPNAKLNSEAKIQSKTPLVFEYIGELDIPWLNFEYGLFGQIVTSASISEDGKKIILLTYENAIEFNLDIANSAKFKTTDLKEGIDYQILPLREVAPQQEAITYLPKSKEFLFTTEKADTSSAGIFKVTCTE